MEYKVEDNEDDDEGTKESIDDTWCPPTTVYCGIIPLGEKCLNAVTKGLRWNLRKLSLFYISLYQSLFLVFISSTAGWVRRACEHLQWGSSQHGWGWGIQSSRLDLRFPWEEPNTCIENLVRAEVNRAMCMHIYVLWLHLLVQCCVVCVVRPPLQLFSNDE